MSEQEYNHISEICNKAEALIEELIGVKVWYKRVTIAMLVVVITCISGAGVVISRQNSMETAIGKAVPRSTLVMLDETYKAQTQAMISLSDGQYQIALKKFEDDCAKIRSNIIMFNSEISTRTVQQK